MMQNAPPLFLGKNCRLIQDTTHLCKPDLTCGASKFSSNVIFLTSTLHTFLQIVWVLYGASFIFMEKKQRLLTSLFHEIVGSPLQTRPNLTFTMVYLYFVFLFDLFSLLYDN